MRRKIASGDVFSFAADSGLYWLQYVLKHPEFGELARVLEPESNKKSDVGFQGKEKFLIFFPISFAYSRGLIRYIDNSSLPQRLEQMPPMRRPGARDKNGNALNWIVIEKNNERIVENLSDEEKKLSLAVIWNTALLNERICSGWTPEQEV